MLLFPWLSTVPCAAFPIPKCNPPAHQPLPLLFNPGHSVTSGAGTRAPQQMYLLPAPAAGSLPSFGWPLTEYTNFTSRAQGKTQSLKMGKQRGRDCMSQEQEGVQELLHSRVAKHRNYRKSSYSFQNPKSCLSPLLSHVAKAEIPLLSGWPWNSAFPCEQKPVTGWLAAGTNYIFMKLQRWKNPKRASSQNSKLAVDFSTVFPCLVFGVVLLFCLSVSSKMIKNCKSFIFRQAHIEREDTAMRMLEAN